MTACRLDLSLQMKNQAAKCDLRPMAASKRKRTASKQLRIKENSNDSLQAGSSPANEKSSSKMCKPDPCKGSFSDAGAGPGAKYIQEALCTNVSLMTTPPTKAAQDAFASKSGLQFRVWEPPQSDGGNSGPHQNAVRPASEASEP